MRTRTGLAQAAGVPAGAVACLARALLAQGCHLEALDTARVAMEQVEALGGVDEGEAEVRLVFAEALDASGARAAAIAAIAAARVRLLERAARITGDTWRRSFLENVPEHGRTIELARAWLVA